MSSGPTVVAIADDDARAVRMANALGGAIGADRDKLDYLIKKLEALSDGRHEDMITVGQNDFAISVTPAMALLWDDYLDGDLEQTEEGLAFSHEELRNGLLWWKDVVEHWWKLHRPEG